MNFVQRYEYMRISGRVQAKIRLQKQISDGLLDEISSSRIYKAISLEITAIDATAIENWRKNWVGHNNRLFDWDWSAEMKGWANTSRRVDAAIWANGELSGLMVGCWTEGRRFLRIDLVEGSPERNNPLKGRVLFCAGEIASTLGKIIGCNYVAFTRPIDAAIPLYQNLGFKLAKNTAKVQFCIKEI